jgi:PAS domain S-box-containing protein
MSKMSRSSLLDSATVLLNSGAGPATIIGKAGQATFNTLVTKLVSQLQRPDYSITDLLHDAAAAKRKFAEAGMPLAQLTSKWSKLDRTVEECLERTIVAHEKFFDNTLHAFCEFDPSGLITFANAKMMEWAPNSVGKELAGFFGKMAPDVRKALAAKDNRRLHQFELVHGSSRYSVLVEFARIEAKGPTSGYALLVDLSELVDAEHKALEESPYGMLKLDPNYRIVYANKRALGFIERTADEVIGRDAADFVSDRQSRNEVKRQRVQRSAGHGSGYPVVIERPKSGKTMHLWVTAVPSFNTSGEINGVLTALQPRDQEVARAEIAHLLATKTDYRALFEGVMKVVGRFIEFDWVDLALYTKKGDYAATLCRLPEASLDYPIRWWWIPTYFRNWIKEDCPCLSDALPDWKKRADARKALKANPEIERLMSKEGRRALIALPIRREDGLIGALSFASKQPRMYDEDTLKLLRDHLAIDQAMLTVFNLREHDEQRFVTALFEKISKAKSRQDLARTIVRELAHFYKFQNVSIFKVNALRGHFRLLAQERGPNGGSAIPEGYTQSVKEGMLGLSLERGKRANMKNSNDGSIEARRYKQVAKEIVSELCIPITLHGRILWILNLEDKQANAFAEPEIEALEGIVKQVESMVQHLFEAQVLTQVIDVFPDGVVIANNKGNILFCNDTAKRIFGRSNISSRTNLRSCLPASDYERSVSEQASPPWTTQISGAKSGKTPLLMSKFILPEEYDHVVLRIQDTTELEWKTDAERLEAALAEAAALVRVPLSLVSSYVRQMRQKGGDDTVELADKAFRQLSRIELTYDRVFAAYGSSELPHEQKVRIDLNRVLEYILGELPESDRTTVKLATAEEPIWVMATSYRLLFALESMLAYLVRSRASAAPITIDVTTSSNKKNIDIVMAGPVLTAEPNGDLQKLVEAMRTEIALGEHLLEKIARECGGTFKRQQKDTHEQLTLRLGLSRH